MVACPLQFVVPRQTQRSPAEHRARQFDQQALAQILGLPRLTQGISADNTIDVTAGAKGVVVKVAKKTVRRSFPLVKSEALTKRSVSRIVAAVRPDLALAAVERAKKILRSQRPVVASTKAKKTRSRK